MIRAIIKRSIIGSNIFRCVMYRPLSLLKEFKQFSLFHIKRELNSSVDRWDKVGSRLKEGKIIFNGVKGSLPIP
jgi:hypothetical protein